MKRILVAGPATADLLWGEPRSYISPGKRALRMEKCIFLEDYAQSPPERPPRSRNTHIWRLPALQTACQDAPFSENAYIRSPEAARVREINTFAVWKPPSLKKYTHLQSLKAQENMKASYSDSVYNKPILLMKISTFILFVCVFRSHFCVM